MTKNFIIWGISDSGYQQSISSSYVDNIIPDQFKKSVSDTHGDLAFCFAKENPNDNYFYSIEHIANKVLYTIYRTNFKGGSSGSRLAYDAVTIIVGKNYIIEKPLISLKLLITSYITQKKAGFGKFNFEVALSGIKLTVNNNLRSISKIRKEGYIKYNLDSELNSIYADKKDKLHNFHKVYFFKNLSLLESGINKIQDLRTIKPLAIKLINFDSFLHKVYVENEQVNIVGNTFNAFEGDEIQIYRGNILSIEKIASSDLIIKLKKPQPKSFESDNRKRKRERKENFVLITILCFLIIFSGIYFLEDIKILFNPKVDTVSTNSNPSEPSKIETITFDGDFFYIATSDTIKDGDTLLMYFKQKSIDFENLSNNYKLVLNDSVWEIKDGSDKKIELNDLDSLRMEIERANNKSITKIMLENIEKVISFQKIRQKGLEFTVNGKMYYNFIYDNKLDQINVWKRSKDENMSEVKNKIEKDKILSKTSEFLRNSIPKNIYNKLYAEVKSEEIEEKYEEVEEQSLNKEPEIGIKNTVIKTEITNEPCEIPIEMNLNDWKYKWKKDYRRLETMFNYGPTDKNYLDYQKELYERIKEADKKLENCTCKQCEEFKKAYKEVEEFIEQERKRKNEE